MKMIKNVRKIGGIKLNIYICHANQHNYVDYNS